jgi:hypothetical protein
MGCPRMIEFDFTLIKLRYGNEYIMLDYNTQLRNETEK